MSDSASTAWVADDPTAVYFGCHRMMLVPRVALYLGPAPADGAPRVQGVAEVVYFDGVSQLVTYEVGASRARMPDRIEVLDEYRQHGFRTEREFENAVGEVCERQELGKRVSLTGQRLLPAYLQQAAVLPTATEEDLLWFRDRAFAATGPTDGMNESSRSKALDDALTEGLEAIGEEDVLRGGIPLAERLQDSLGGGQLGRDLQLLAAVLAVLGQGWQDGPPDVLTQLCQAGQPSQAYAVDGRVHDLVARVREHPGMRALQAGLSAGLAARPTVRSSRPSVPLRMSMAQWVQEQLRPDALALMFSWNHPA